MLNRLKALKPDNIEIKDIGRLPQVFRRKSKIGSFTVDEEFDQLHKQVTEIESGLKIIVSQYNSVAQQWESQLHIVESLSNNYERLLDPYNRLNENHRSDLKQMSFSKVVNGIQKLDQMEEFNRETDIWAEVVKYKDCVINQKQSMGNMSEISEIVSSKCSVALSLIRNINKKIKERRRKVDDYDSLVLQLHNLNQKQTSTDISTKEAQTVFYLERKVQGLAQIFFKQVLYLIYFDQLCYYYRVSDALLVFDASLKIFLTGATDLHTIEEKSNKEEYI